MYTLYIYVYVYIYKYNLFIDNFYFLSIFLSIFSIFNIFKHIDELTFH